MDVRDNIMRKGVFNKFIQNTNLLDVLINTDDELLIYYNSKDKYWGGISDSGENKLGKILMETRNILSYKVTPVGNRNFWVILNLLLIGYIDVPILNQVGVKYLLDLSGNNVVSQKILGQVLPDPISVYQGQIIFVSLPEETPSDQLVDLTIQSFGKDYTSYIFANKEKYLKFLSILFSQLYELPIDLSSELIRKLIQ